MIRLVPAEDQRTQFCMDPSTGTRNLLFWIAGEYCKLGRARAEGSVEAIGRMIVRSLGRRQGTILVPTAARHYCPAAGLAGLGKCWNEDATSGSREGRDQRRDRYVTSDAIEVWPRRDIEGRLKHVPHRSAATSVAQASVREKATPAWRAAEARAASPASWLP
jgi:hypothetical protein